jgi:hypothetical protein
MLLGDELLRRLAYYDQEVAALDARLDTLAAQFPRL